MSRSAMSTGSSSPGFIASPPGVLEVLKIVKPETVVRWHRAGFPCLLALEVASARWTTKHALWRSPAYSGEKHREPALGSAADPWRAAQARGTGPAPRAGNHGCSGWSIKRLPCDRSAIWSVTLETFPDPACASLRVCPGTLSGITKFSEHEAD